MFAYCNNNPVISIDPTGTDPFTLGIIALGAAVVAGAVALAALGGELLGAILEKYPFTTKPVSVNDIHDSAAYAAARMAKDVYEYRKAVAEALTKTKESIPHVHHIVPVGSFSTRAPATQAKISEMHNKLRNVGINYYIDPMNLVPVSSKVHAHLHTDTYISHVHDYIMAADDSVLSIYGALFYLRLEIAAWDVHAIGY